MANASSNPAVTVVGSLNVDYIASVGRLPSPGETIGAQDLEVVFGGKGANQAIAAARQGAEVGIVGTVGQDEMGKAYLAHLEREGIETSRILETPVAATGSAFINVDDEGENMIVVAAGANGLTVPENVRAAVSEIQEANLLLAQFEVPLTAVVEAITMANEAGVPTVVNPSPIRQTFPWQEVTVDYVITNEGEAEELIGFSPRRRRDAELVGNALQGIGIGTLIVTRGSESTLVFAPAETLAVPTLPVLPIDTVGAGDAFAGCFAARIAGGESLEESIRAANCAGALATLGSSAQEPLPDRGQVDQHRERLQA